MHGSLHHLGLQFKITFLFYFRATEMERRNHLLRLATEKLLVEADLTEDEANFQVELGKMV